MICGRFVSVCALVVAATAVATAATTRDDIEIQQWINQHAKQAHSVEVPAARYRVVGALDGDGRNDVAVLYTLKLRAANDGESRYLAAFKRLSDNTSRPGNAHRSRREGGLRYQAHTLVSGPGAGEANRVTILNRAVVVEMLTFGPGDSACCPTRATTRRYRVAERGLVLVRADPAKRAR